MRLKAGCDLVLESPERSPCVTLLRPRSGDAQWVCNERYRFEPSLHPTEFVDGFGNLCQRFVAPPGRLHLRAAATVETDDQIAVDLEAPATPVQALPDAALQFLLQSRYCPADDMATLATQITSGCAPGYAQVEAIRAWVHGHIAYRYGVSDEYTSALDTLADGAGVCRDFAHVGIALCRSLAIPARMVVGYLYQLDPMDLHAWFEAFVGGRWYTFDATQPQPRGGRIVLAYGRDAADVAFVSNYGALQTVALRVWVHLDNRRP
jgi:transglutaminase-like putative cysteine protease